MSDFENNNLIQKDKIRKRGNMLTIIVITFIPVIIIVTALGLFFGFKSDEVGINIQNIIKSSANISAVNLFRLTYMCNFFGPRLSGSEGLEKALDYMVEELNKDGLDLVKTEDVWVPKWVRGNESLYLLAPYYRKLDVMALGGSISTNGDLRAQVVVVKSFAELETVDVTGKIVVYNQDYKGYGGTVEYRSQGAVRAAAKGAVASLTRSITPFSLSTPHTGGQSSNLIPACAITVEIAEQFQFLQDNGVPIEIVLNIEAQTFNNSLSRNVIAQLNGTSDKIIVFGGHTDSWDVGVGAQDDAGGVFACWSALLILKNLRDNFGLKLKHNIRFVGWTNEENGSQGAQVYAQMHANEAAQTMLAFESDVGIFSPFTLQYPMGAAFSGNSENGWKFIVENFRRYLANAPISIDSVERAGGGVDIAPLYAQGIPAMSLGHKQNDKYFWYHHTNADTPDKIDEIDFQKASSIIASLVYLIDHNDIDFRK